MIPIELKPSEIQEGMDPVKSFVGLMVKNRILDEKESKIISAVLTNGEKIDARSLVKKVELHVSNVYKILDALIDKGIVMKEKFDGKYYFWMDSVNPIHDLWVRKFEDLETNYNDFCDMYGLWNRLVKKRSADVFFGNKVIHHFETNDEFFNLIVYIIDCAEKEIIGSSIESKFIENIRVSEAFKRAIKRGVSVRFLHTDKTPQSIIKWMDTMNVQHKETTLDTLSLKLSIGFLVSDKKHGIMLTSYIGNERNGLWFMNRENPIVDEFEKLWKKVGSEKA